MQGKMKNFESVRNLYGHLTCDSSFWTTVKRCWHWGDYDKKTDFYAIAKKRKHKNWIKFCRKNVNKSQIELFESNDRFLMNAYKKCLPILFSVPYFSVCHFFIWDVLKRLFKILSHLMIAPQIDLHSMCTNEFP